MFDSQNRVELRQSVSDANCYKAGTVPGMMRITLSYDCDSTLASFSRINLDQYREAERRQENEPIKQAIGC
jgi:hypothetical protein